MLVGGLAQLGERLHGMQEVSGSIPLVSTKSNMNEHAESGVFFDLEDYARSNEMGRSARTERSGGIRH
jgi:hypothetical protein